MLRLKNEMVGEHNTQRQIELSEDTNCLSNERHVSVALLFESILDFFGAHVKARA